MTKNVVVYSQHGRMFCEQAKEFLSQKGIEFHKRGTQRKILTP
jgi:hypothetical protein